MQTFIDFMVTTVLPLAALIGLSCLVRYLLPGPFSGGCGG